MVSCSTYSSRTAGRKIVIVFAAAPRTITIFPPALLTLLIPNTTANHTITYTNTMGIITSFHETIMIE